MVQPVNSLLFRKVLGLMVELLIDIDDVALVDEGEQGEVMTPKFSAPIAVFVVGIGTGQFHADEAGVSIECGEEYRQFCYYHSEYCNEQYRKKYYHCVFVVHCCGLPSWWIWYYVGRRYVGFFRGNFFEKDLPVPLQKNLEVF